MNKVLRQLLDAGVFEVGDNDDRLKQLETSVSDLVKIFNANKKLIAPYTIVGLDSNTHHTDPALLETEYIVKKYWPTLRQKFPDTPKTLLCAVIFSSLHEFALTNMPGAKVFFLSGSNFFRFGKFDREKDVLQASLLEISSIVEKSAIEEWSVKSELPVFKLPPLKASELTDPLTSASLEPAINKFFADFKKVTNEALASSFKSMQASDKRGKLLWWKETLYSVSQEKSYRDINPTLLPILLPVDLITQIPLNCPKSVDFLLREVLMTLKSNSKDQIKIAELLKELLIDKNREFLQNMLQEPEGYEGKLTLTDFIALNAWNKLTIKDLTKRTGISEKILISECDLTVIIFHDLLCEAINHSQ